jgi:hypothetical protein
MMCHFLFDTVTELKDSDWHCIGIVEQESAPALEEFMILWRREVYLIIDRYDMVRDALWSNSSASRGIWNVSKEKRGLPRVLRDDRSLYFDLSCQLTHQHLGATTHQDSCD